MLIGAMTVALIGLAISGRQVLRLRKKASRAPLVVTDAAVIGRQEFLNTAISVMGAAVWDWEIGTDRMFAGQKLAEILGLDIAGFPRR